METTAAGSRRHPLTSSPSPALDLDENQDCTGGGGWRSLKAWCAPSPPPGGPGVSPGLWNLWVVVACLTFPALVFVSGVYRPPLAFFSGIAGGTTTSQQLQHHQQQELLADGTQPPVAAPSNSTVAEIRGAVAPTPAPSSSGELSHVMLRNATVPAPSPAPVGGRSGSRSSPGARFYKASMAASPSPSSHAGAHDDKLLGGLLAAGFDEGSCHSRYRSHEYRKASPYRSSPYLLRMLREYEALHRRCGPFTRSYKRALHLLTPGGGSGAPGASCKYVVWDAENGLGNRMLSMASAFLYALLSKRVFLVDRTNDLAGLFCEPFPGSTWLLPHAFPLQHLPFGQKYPKSYGNLLRTNGTGTNGGSAPVFVYAHLSNDYDDYDKRFYCEDDQLVLEKVPWMALRSDQYFASALFLNPAFERELVRMFPQKEAVFHHLGRYLFHPSNEVWGLITGYYRDHLAPARERLGMQIRVFQSKRQPFELILRQILNCTLSEKLLPEVDLLQGHVTPTTGRPTKAVLLASLHSVFYERMKKLYSERTAESGEVISFHQPSHEEEQRTGRAAHDAKALAEMYLLSLADTLVTSSWSTFGYVAQGFAGMTPWVLLGPVLDSVPEPACVRDMSPEPCFHFPPNYDCKTGRHVDMAKLVPHMTHCKDWLNGVKFVEQRS